MFFDDYDFRGRGAAKLKVKKKNIIANYHIYEILDLMILTRTDWTSEIRQSVIRHYFSRDQFQVSPNNSPGFAITAYWC